MLHSSSKQFKIPRWLMDLKSLRGSSANIIRLCLQRSFRMRTTPVAGVFICILYFNMNFGTSTIVYIWRFIVIFCVAFPIQFSKVNKPEILIRFSGLWNVYGKLHSLLLISQLNIFIYGHLEYDKLKNL